MLITRLVNPKAGFKRLQREILGYVLCFLEQKPSQILGCAGWVSLPLIVVEQTGGSNASSLLK